MKICLLSILSLFLCQHMNAQAENSALCFLTYSPTSEILEFAQELAQDAIKYDVNVFIMIDDNNFTLSSINISFNLQLLQISDEKCLEHNYRKTIGPSDWGEVISWDKALLYFSILNKNYSFIWLIEDDVFIPSIQAFRSLHELYSNITDLVVPRNGLNLLGDPSFWKWSMAIGQFVPPWSRSMANIVGLSRRMLIAIDDYVQWLGQVPFYEFFFNTLAMQLNFTIVTPTELSTDVFSTTYYFKDIRKQPNNLWHPVKGLDIQKQWRQSLSNTSLINNHTIELTNLETLCYNNQNMTTIEQYLTDLLIKFEISKSNFSANSRRLLRQRFSQLAEKCKMQNASKETIFIAMKLADHAYKLPEPPVEELVTNKSLYHLELEQALKKNKEIIFQLPSNSSTVVKLRRQTANLIKKLTSEIQREYEEQENSFLENEIQSSSSFPYTTTTTNDITSDLFSSSQMTIAMKVNQRFNQLTTKNENQMVNSIGNKMQIPFLISTIFCLLFMFLKWKNIRRQNHLTIILILLLLFVVGMLCNIISI